MLFGENKENKEKGSKKKQKVRNYFFKVNNTRLKRGMLIKLSS